MKMWWAHLALRLDFPWVLGLSAGNNGVSRNQNKHQVEFPMEGTSADTNIAQLLSLIKMQFG